MKKLSKAGILIIALAITVVMSCAIIAASVINDRANDSILTPADDLTFVKEMTVGGKKTTKYKDAENNTYFFNEKGEMYSVRFDNNVKASENEKQEKITAEEARAIAEKYARNLLGDDLSILETVEVTECERAYDVIFRHDAEIEGFTVHCTSVFVSVNFDGSIYQYSEYSFKDEKNFDDSVLDSLTLNEICDFVKSEMDPSVHQGEFIRLDRIYLEYNVDNGYYLNVGAILGFEDGIKYAEEFFYPLS